MDSLEGDFVRVSCFANEAGSNGTSDEKGRICPADDDGDGQTFQGIAGRNRKMRLGMRFLCRSWGGDAER